MTFEVKDAGTNSKNQKIFVLMKGGRGVLTLRAGDSEATDWMDRINQNIKYAVDNKLLKDTAPLEKEKSIRRFWGGTGSGHQSEQEE